MHLNSRLNGETEPTERSPLLPRAALTQSERYVSELSKYVGEMSILVKSMASVVLAYALQNSLQTASVMVVGRYSPEALATAAFSYMFAMATGWLVGLGGTTALDTLASASFTGLSNKCFLGLLLQRGLIILTAFYGVVAVLWWNTKPIFEALGQEEFICQQSPIFLRYLIPGGLGYIWFEAMKKFLQSQGQKPFLPTVPRHMLISE
ncbi:hypothetical protein NQ176_g9666 [Zarea fungicola]|uniref:Uncharacterized protein n=1 Tax=Zarea fungicola TaxID=93591 RepID=A0ACC1MKG4_9HYPO|nr:hypothetical protein NQ176_g9666 [Lecanicillium fungicola]